MECKIYTDCKHSSEEGSILQIGAIPMTILIVSFGWSRRVMPRHHLSTSCFIFPGGTLSQEWIIVWQILAKF